MRSLLAGNSYSQGLEIPGSPGTTLRYEGAIESRGVDIPAVYAFVMSVATGVAAAIIVNWMRDKFRGRAEKVTLNRREIDLDDEGQIRRVVEEEIQIRPQWLSDRGPPTRTLDWPDWAGIFGDLRSGARQGN